MKTYKQLLEKHLQLLEAMIIVKENSFNKITMRELMRDNVSELLKSYGSITRARLDDLPMAGTVSLFNK